MRGLSYLCGTKQRTPVKVQSIAEASHQFSLICLLISNHRRCVSDLPRIIMPFIIKNSKLRQKHIQSEILFSVEEIRKFRSVHHSYRKHCTRSSRVKTVLALCYLRERKYMRMGRIKTASEL